MATQQGEKKKSSNLYTALRVYKTACNHISRGNCWRCHLSITAAKRTVTITPFWIFSYSYLSSSFSLSFIFRREMWWCRAFYTGAYISLIKIFSIYTADQKLSAVGVLLLGTSTFFFSFLLLSFRTNPITHVLWCRRSYCRRRRCIMQ